MFRTTANAFKAPTTCDAIVLIHAMETMNPAIENMIRYAAGRCVGVVVRRKGTNKMLDTSIETMMGFTNQPIGRSEGDWLYIDSTVKTGAKYSCMIVSHRFQPGAGPASSFIGDGRSALVSPVFWRTGLEGGVMSPIASPMMMPGVSLEASCNIGVLTWC